MSAGTMTPVRPRRVAGGGPPGAPAGGDGGGGSGWTRLAVASNDIEAHLLEGCLLEAGIETRTVKDRTAPGAWLMGGSNPWAPVEVHVRRFQLDDARLVLLEVAAGWAGIEGGDR